LKQRYNRAGGAGLRRHQLDRPGRGFPVALGTAARARIQSRYSLTSVINAYQAFYAEISNDPAAA